MLFHMILSRRRNHNLGPSNQEFPKPDGTLLLKGEGQPAIIFFSCQQLPPAPPPQGMSAERKLRLPGRAMQHFETFFKGGVNLGGNGFLAFGGLFPPNIGSKIPPSWIWVFDRFRVPAGSSCQSAGPPPPRTPRDPQSTFFPNTVFRAAPLNQPWGSLPDRGMQNMLLLFVQVASLSFPSVSPAAGTPGLRLTAGPRLACFLRHFALHLPASHWPDALLILLPSKLCLFANVLCD